MEHTQIRSISVSRALRGVLTAGMAVAALGFAGVAAQANDGSMMWRGNVDNVTRIVIRRNDIREHTVSGRGADSVRSRFNGGRIGPNDQIRLTDVRGRGQVRIVEYPSRRNGWETVVEIRDPDRGSSPYSFRLEWDDGGRGNRYDGGWRSGRRNWP